MPDKAEVVVVGSGPAGLTAAVAFATGGVPTVLIGRKPNDNRTTALLASSVTALETLGVWDFCREQAGLLRTMRIVDDTGRLWRAPEVAFGCEEIDLEAFAYNIENRHLIAALQKRAEALPLLRMLNDDVLGLRVAENRVTVETSHAGALEAPLVIGADGRRSLCREAALIDTKERRTPQTALTVSFAHTRAHNDASTEFHTVTGQFTLVPLPGNRSSLVWVLDPDDAEAKSHLDDASLSAEIEKASHSILGKISVEPGRGVFPLSVIGAERFAANRIALVGEAAHIIPPVGAQGLNLGLRDAAAIAELVAAAWRAGRDVGSNDLFFRYDRMRRADVGTRTLAADLLNRSLLTGFLPVQGLRGLGLYALDRIGPLRRAVMREGVAPTASQPRLMRGMGV
jgi:2-octaprenyl-6-methoxyphenol hydroxylase